MKENEPDAVAQLCRPLGFQVMDHFFDCQCNPSYLSNANELFSVGGFTECFVLLNEVLETVKKCGLTVMGHSYQPFPEDEHGNASWTLAVTLAESHLCLHTWPAEDRVDLDIYVCHYTQDNTEKATALHESLRQLFMPLECSPAFLQRTRK